jgi:hypothetical protein
MLLESAFDGLDETGWRKLSRNWAWFFLFLAALNEVLRHALTFDGWLAPSSGASARSRSCSPSCRSRCCCAMAWAASRPRRRKPPPRD